MAFGTTACRLALPAVGLVAVLVTGGCAEDIKTQPPPPVRVSVLFDPGVSLIPAPNDFAKSAETGLLQLPVADADVQPAQASFDRYLNTLDGFPTSSSPSFCLSAEVDVTSLESGIKVLLLPKAAGIAPEDVTDQVSVSTPEQTLECPVLTDNSCDPSQESSGCAASQRCVSTSQNVQTLGRCADPGYRVDLVPSSPWLRARSYGVYVTSAIRDADGQSVIRSPQFELVAAQAPVCAWDQARDDCVFNYASLISTSVERRIAAEQPNLSGKELDDEVNEAVLETSTGFERLRLATNDLVVTAELDPSEVMLAWSFSTVGLVEALFDPAAGEIPGPSNDLVFDLVANKVDLPKPPDETAEEEVLRLRLNERDGFSTTGASFGRFSGKVDAETVRPGLEYLLVKLSDAVEPPLDAEFSYVEGARAVTVRPRLPLEERTHYAVLLMSKLVREAGSDGQDHLVLRSGGGLADGNGRRIAAAPVFALTRSAAPLVEQGKSTVNVLDDDDAAQLEPIRQGYDQVLSSLEAGLGIEREDVVLLWTFHTQSTTDSLVQLRQDLYSALETDEQRVNPGDPRPRLSVEKVFTTVPTCTQPEQRECWRGTAPQEVTAWYIARFDGWNAADPETGELDPKLAGQSEPIRFYLSVPKGIACDAGACTEQGFVCQADHCVPGVSAAGWPTVVLQHGLGSSKEQFFALADELAASGFATIAFDTVFHGDRTVCLADQHCRSDVDGISCDQTQVPPRCCLGATCGPEYLLTQGGVPVASGAALLDFSNPFALADRLKQQVLDSLALTRALRHDADHDLGSDHPLDRSRIHYVGQSLGAMLGVPLLALDSLGASMEDPLLPTPVATRAAFNVPGAPFVRFLVTSQAPQIKAAVDAAFVAAGYAPDSPQGLEWRYVLQWIIDPAEPANFARHVGEVALEDRVATKAAGETVMVPLKSVFMQTATQDPVITPPNQQAMADALSADLSKSTFDTADHFFLLPIVQVSPTGTTRAAQSQVCTFISSGAVCQPDTDEGVCR